ncbi:MAG: site-specific integrase [Myxococcales bacterium]|nr:site-specific integrase [Myxococcales bacterium]
MAKGIGQGSIFKRTRRGKTQWVGEICVGRDSHGKRRMRTVYARTKAEVSRRLEDLRVKARAGVDPDAGRQLLSAYLDAWLADRELDLKPRTRSNYRDLLAYIKPHLGHRRLEDLHPLDVKGWLAGLQRQGVGARTRQAARSLLINALGEAVRHNSIATNPAERTAAPKVKTGKREVLENDQVKALLTAVQDHPYEALFVLAVLHGLRYGELAGLAWGAVYFRKGAVHVRQALSEDPRTGHCELVAPKTEASRREIPLSQLAIDALRRHRTRLGKLATRDLLVFTSPEGGWLRRSNFHRRVWRPIKAKAQLPANFRLQDLRHVCASTLLASGQDVPTVAATLGHSSPAVTMRIYAHALTSKKHEAAALMDALFGSTGS